ncbi:MAG: VanZ family protein [Nitrospiraceae bacterium]
MKEVSDKVLHFCEYSVLGALTFRACRHAAGPTIAQSAFSYAVAFCACYGASDEIHQLFVPFREADVLDLVADVAGASAGGLVWSVLGRERI